MSHVICKYVRRFLPSPTRVRMVAVFMVKIVPIVVVVVDVVVVLFVVVVVVVVLIIVFLIIIFLHLIATSPFLLEKASLQRSFPLPRAE